MLPVLAGFVREPAGAGAGGGPICTEARGGGPTCTEERGGGSHLCWKYGWTHLRCRYGAVGLMRRRHPERWTSSAPGRRAAVSVCPAHKAVNPIWARAEADAVHQWRVPADEPTSAGAPVTGPSGTNNIRRTFGR